MKVSEVCKGVVVTIHGFDDVLTAAQRMRKRHVGYLVVVESMAHGGEAQDGVGERPIGVLTDRDLVVTVMAGAVDPRSLTVADVMTPRPVTMHEADDVADALGKMRQIGVRRLPVVGDDGTLVGILALDDVVDSLAGALQNVADSVRQEQKMERVARP
jgi:CBS domain-containing protein